MKKVTKSLLMILTFVFSLFTISSCSKKIEYVYEDVGSAFTTYREYLPYQEYVLDTTGTTHRKISKHKIAYECYTLGSQKAFRAYLSDNAKIGIRYSYRDENTPSWIHMEDPIILTPVSSSNGIDEYLITKRDQLVADIVVVADKKTNYSIKVKAVFDKLGEDTYLIGEDGIRIGSTASLEGNNNVYYVEKDIDETIESNSEDKYDLIGYYNRLTESLDKSHEFMNIFTDEEETTYVTVNEKYLNTTNGKYKINVRKADEYNLEDIIDSEGNVYIDGDFNEWVVINLDNSEYNYDIYYEERNSGSMDWGFPRVLSKRIEPRYNDYTKQYDYIIRWYNVQGNSLDTDSICIRKGKKYNIVKAPKTYLKVNGVSYNDNDTISLKDHDTVELYYLDDSKTAHYISADIYIIYDDIMGGYTLGTTGKISIPYKWQGKIKCIAVDSAFRCPSNENEGLLFVINYRFRVV